jgi:hypothetical protein
MAAHARIEYHESDNGQFYYTVKAKNGETLATSETYARKEDLVRGEYELIAAVLDVVAGQAAKNVTLDESEHRRRAEHYRGRWEAI